MAYSNWGACVYRDGERRNDREDVPVFGDAEIESVPSAGRIWLNILRRQEKQRAGEPQPDHTRIRHAVLGDGRVRLCGYKSFPEVFVVEDDGTVSNLDLTQFSEEGVSWFEGADIDGEIHGVKFHAVLRVDPERVILELTEPDGTKWTGESGYAMGAGWE